MRSARKLCVIIFYVEAFFIEVTTQSLNYGLETAFGKEDMVTCDQVWHVQSRALDS